ncbi:MAG: hypothetical protein ACO1Q7_02930 [Gemmatimonas sp.]
MTSRFWKRGVAVLCVAFGIPAILWWGAKQAAEGMFASDEVTTRQTVVPMLDGAVSLGLYRQNMWDAILWTVIATGDSMPRTIAAHNAVLDSAVKRLVIGGESQLGFRDPPVRLERQSQTDATLCSKLRCQKIRCDAATRVCYVDTR